MPDFFSFEGVCVAVAGTEPGTVRYLLHDLNLRLSQSKVAFIGANGSGKSTALQLLNGLIPAGSGQVTSCGLNPATCGRQVRQQVGMLFSDPAAQLLMPTPAEDIALSLPATVKGAANRRAQALNWLQRFGLEDLADHSSYNLSGGERQLVALITVLAGEPAALLADEPTTLLDLPNRLRLHRYLLAQPIPLVIATHDLELAAQTDRVIVLDKGKISCDDTPEIAIKHYRQQSAS